MSRHHTDRAIAILHLLRPGFHAYAAKYNADGAEMYLDDDGNYVGYVDGSKGVLISAGEAESGAYKAEFARRTDRFFKALNK